ncbi:MAG: hypothetical protein ABIJ97_05825 [Bacteroidota bacterium]
MKPVKTLAFVLSVFFILAVIMMVFPENGIKIIDNFSIKFPNIKNFFFAEKKNYADISDAIKKGSVNIDSLSLFLDTDTINADTIRVSVDSLKGVIHKLEFQNENRSSLDAFFGYLKTKPEILHIMHFGDSQIEGDRISGVLRNRLQSRFGGYGVGTMAAIGVINVSGPIAQSGSDNWKRYTVFGKRDTSLKHTQYGALGIFARFAPLWNDSIPNDSILYEAELTFETSSVGYASDKKFDNVRIFYGNNHKPILAELYIDEEMKQFETMMSTATISSVKFNFEETPKKFTLKFSGKDSPDIYGVSFESKNGIFVDNIPMRGSSGLDFTRMSMSFQKQMFDLLNTKLIICEFGVNLVPNIVDDYTFYENWFYEQLRSLKKVNPELSIIVIGVSDMSLKKDDYYESYPNIEKIRNAQKKAAFRADCAFWDFYEAMGGNNSMPSWVFAKPSLATQDFTHLNYKGARIIGDMFSNALIWEYNEFLKKKSKEIL